MKTLNVKLMAFTGMKIVSIFMLAFFAATSFAALPLTDSEKASFSIPDTATITSHAVNQQLTTPTVIPFDIAGVVSLSVDADILLNTKDSFVRILAKDDQGKEYLVFDSVTLTPQDTFNLTNYAEETIDLNSVNIKSISVEVDDASVNLYSINIEDSTSQRAIDFANKTDVDKTAELSTLKNSQIAIKTAKINARNAVESLNFTTGPTNRISKLTYEQKKQIFHKPDGTAFDSLPNLNGLDYYIGGSFNDTGVIVDCDKVDQMLGTALTDDGTVGPQYFHPFVVSGSAAPASTDAVMIPDVPIADWSLSPANTAALMTVSYWAYQGYSNILPDSTNTVIAAPTDQAYGHVLISDIAPAVQGYAQARTYTTAIASYVSPLSLSALKGEIDSNRPMLLVVDTNGDGIPDSVVTAVGYDNTTSQYACYTTLQSLYSPDVSEKWFNFTPAAKGAQWGVSGGVTFNAAPAAIVAAATTSTTSAATTPTTDTTASSTTSGATASTESGTGTTSPAAFTAAYTMSSGIDNPNVIKHDSASYAPYEIVVNDITTDKEYLPNTLTVTWDVYKHVKLADGTESFEKVTPPANWNFACAICENGGCGGNGNDLGMAFLKKAQTTTVTKGSISPQTGKAIDFAPGKRYSFKVGVYTITTNKYGTTATCHDGTVRFSKEITIKGPVMKSPTIITPPTVTPNSVKLDWTYPTDESSLAPDHYEIWGGKNYTDCMGSVQTTPAGIVKEKTFTESGLIPNTKYKYIVRPIAPGGASVPGTDAIIEVTTSQIKPKAPKNATAGSMLDINNCPPRTCMKVSWGSGNDAGDPTGPMNYYVAREPNWPAQAKDYRADVKTTSLIDSSGLIVGGTYKYTIYAHNGAGDSDPATASGTFTLTVTW